MLRARGKNQAGRGYRSFQRKERHPGGVCGVSEGVVTLEREGALQRKKKKSILGQKKKESRKDPEKGGGFKKSLTE